MNATVLTTFALFVGLTLAITQKPTSTTISWIVSAVRMYSGIRSDSSNGCTARIRIENEMKNSSTSTHARCERTSSTVTRATDHTRDSPVPSRAVGRRNSIRKSRQPASRNPTASSETMITPIIVVAKSIVTSPPVQQPAC